jgi:hypothetical protein
MRNLILCCLFLLCAAVLVACSDPIVIARREVGRIEKITVAAETEVDHGLRMALLDMARVEGKRRGQELKAADCGAACATQPSTALVDPCKTIVASSEQRYEKRASEIQAAWKKADAAIISVYAALQVVVDVLKAVVAGQKADGWEAKLATGVAAAVSAWGACQDAVKAWKAAIGGAK